MGASGAILDTLCGRTWRASLLAHALVWWRGKRQERLKARTKRSEGEDLEPIEHLKWRLRTRFPQAGTCTPTALGDVLLAYDQSVQERFGMRLAALWEPLRAVVASEDAAVKAAADEKSGVDLSANLAFAGALFIFEALVVFGLLGDWDAMLIAVAGLPVIYLAYRVTVTRALSWCDAIDTVVLLHRKALLEKAGLRTPATAAKQRDALRRLGGFLLRDGKADDLFDAPAAAAAPALTSSKNVTSPWSTTRSASRPTRTRRGSCTAAPSATCCSRRDAAATTAPRRRAPRGQRRARAADPRERRAGSGVQPDPAALAATRSCGRCRRWRAASRAPSATCSTDGGSRPWERASPSRWRTPTRTASRLALHATGPDDAGAQVRFFHTELAGRARSCGRSPCPTRRRRRKSMTWSGRSRACAAAGLAQPAAGDLPAPVADEASAVA